MCRSAVSEQDLPVPAAFCPSAFLAERVPCPSGRSARPSVCPGPAIPLSSACLSQRLPVRARTLSERHVSPVSERPLSALPVRSRISPSQQFPVQVRFLCSSASLVRISFTQCLPCLSDFLAVPAPSLSERLPGPKRSAPCPSVPGAHGKRALSCMLQSRF